MKVTPDLSTNSTNLVALALVLALARILLAGVKGTAITPHFPVLTDLLLTGPLQFVPALPLLGVQVLDEAALKKMGNDFLQGNPT